MSFHVEPRARPGSTVSTIREPHVSPDSGSRPSVRTAVLMSFRARLRPDRCVSRSMT